MKPDNLAQLKDDLRNYHADLESPEVRAELVDASLPRLLATLEMIPESTRGGNFLELGATPFFFTLCLRNLVKGRIKLGNWFGTKDTRGTQRLTHSRSGETIELEYDLFNIETDLFPYPDASFDVVIFSELIEHLGVNPVRTLSEIHRVLRPGGYMILTTPNSISIDRLETFLRGGSQMVDRYSPLFGPGARHNREYHPRELHALLDGNGFAIEELVVRDLFPHPPRERFRRSALRLLLAWEAFDQLDSMARDRWDRLTKYVLAWDTLDAPAVRTSRLSRIAMFLLGWDALRAWHGPPTGLRDRIAKAILPFWHALDELGEAPHAVRDQLRTVYEPRLEAARRENPRDEHIFLRARRSGDFRWRFDPSLFDNIDFYILVRHPWMAMNVNDSIQCGEGWYPMEERDGKAVRRIRGVSQGFLKSPAGQLTFHLSLFAPEGVEPLRVHVIVWDRWLGRPRPDNVYVDAVVPIARGSWQELDLPLERQPRANDEIEIRIAVNGDARAAPDAEQSEDRHGLAVHRFWFTSV